jgi:hypothetical protein
MAMTWINVVRSDGEGDGDEFFMDGMFAERAGRIGNPLRTETGKHTFEVVDAGFNALFRATQTVDKPQGNSKSNPVLVTLDPV